MDEISLKALAKINLGLDVLGKREDGYHEVRMVMQTIHLYDRVEIKKTRSPHIHVETNLYYLPVNEDNLVYRAAKLMKDEFQIKEGVRIVLQKFIPVAAGLAGGSADGAAVLVALDNADASKKATASADNLRAQIKDYLEDSARARMEVDVARREVERLNREISDLRDKLAAK